MACVSSRKNKGGVVYDIQFYIGDGKQKLCGYKTKRQAERAGDKVDGLVRSKAKGVEIPDDVKEWLAGISDKQYAKLESLGLVPVRVKPGTVKELVEMFTNDKTAKPQTIKNRQTAGRHIYDFFGADTPVTSITPAQAVDFDREMRERLAKATWGREVKTVKQFFNRAVELEWIKGNPFGKLKGSNATNKTRFYFITMEETQRILNACPNAEMRLIFSLARFGGLRIPSELQFMEWSDIDIDGDRFILRVPKATSKKNQEAGRLETRPVPMFPELRKAFREYWESLPDGAGNKVFPNLPNGQALTSRFSKILNRAGVAKWEKFFQNMRSTRDTELRRKCPEQDVNLWLGHTKEVALNHYMQTTDSLFSEVSQEGFFNDGCNYGDTGSGKTAKKAGLSPENTESNPPEKMGIIMGTLLQKMGINMGMRCSEVNGSKDGLNPQNRALTQEKEKSLHLLQAQIIPSGGVEPPY